jgi:hypothetical protein
MTDAIPRTGASVAARSRATIPTASASRYLQQLCKHWTHKFAVTFDPRTGTIPFDNGAVAVLEADDAALTVRLAVPDAEILEQMQRVIAVHLDRFAFREAPLPFDWQTDDPAG